MKQHIRYCTSADGVRIAFAVHGTGYPMIRASTYMTHLERDWNSPVWHHWLTDLGRHFTLVRHDHRGCGLSDRDVDEFSMEAWVGDLDAVVNTLGLERFALLGPSQGGSVAIEYAVRHPDQVSHLVLYGAYARGRFHRTPSREQLDQAQAMLDLIRVGWGKDNPAFRQVFTTLFMPEGTPEQISWFNELQRISTSPENAARMEAAFFGINVSESAPRVTAPTLVLHTRDDAMVDFEEGRQLAAMIPGARFVPLESRNHLLLAGEPAWRQFVDEVVAFVSSDATAASAPMNGAAGWPSMGELTRREVEILELLAQGLSNRRIAERLGVSEKTVRNHTSNIYSKLQVSNRGEAIVLVRDAGLGRSRS